VLNRLRNSEWAVLASDRRMTGPSVVAAGAAGVAGTALPCVSRAVLGTGGPLAAAGSVGRMLIRGGATLIARRIAAPSCGLGVGAPVAAKPPGSVRIAEPLVRRAIGVASAAAAWAVGTAGAAAVARAVVAGAELPVVVLPVAVPAG